MLLLTAQNELPLFFIKDMNQSKPIYIASIPNRCTQHQPKNNLHSINPITVHTASDFLSVGFASPKTLTLRTIPHHSVILRGAERRSRRIHHPKNNPRPPRERGDRRRRWLRAREEHFPLTLICPRAPSP